MHSATTHKANGRPIKIWRGLQFVCSFWLLISFGSHLALGQVSLTNTGETLRIVGHYSYIFSNGAPPKTNNFHFIALTASYGWSISATNDDNSKDWGLMRYDGTNIYTIVSDASFLNAHGGYGDVYPGSFFAPQSQDSVHLFFPWLTFHLSPDMVQQSSNLDRVITMPPPWSNARYSVVDYGYRWKLGLSDDDQMIRRIDVVRDSTLDLNGPEDEFRRHLLDYPFSISTRGVMAQMLDLRKSVPNGFLFSIYECTQAVHTNGFLIPLRSHFAEYYPVSTKDATPRIQFECRLRVDRFDFSDKVTIPVIIPPVETSVSDYRYTLTNSRTKFNYATYTINAGDQFKSGNDPKLLAEAQDWLRHGPGYESYRSKRVMILVGMVIITLLFIGLYYFRPKASK